MRFPELGGILHHESHNLIIRGMRNWGFYVPAECRDYSGMRVGSTRDRCQNHSRKVRMEEKHVLDVISAILASGIVSGKNKVSSKGAAKVFFDVRDELLKGMLDRELDRLPVYLTQSSGKRMEQ